MKAIVVFLFLAGFSSFALLFLCVISLFFYVFGESDYLGDIAFLPKWVFLFSPFVFLWRRKEIQDFVNRLKGFL